MGIFSYARKVNKIQKRPGATAYFTLSEISQGIVNLWDAKQKLTEQEYFFVSVVHETYKRIDKQLCLDYFGFLGVCNEIIANFDLVAPYYKFCGNNRYAAISAITDDEKSAYRTKAKILLDKKEIFREEWMQLHKEFLEEFYS